MNLLSLADETLQSHIAANPYPGRGLAIGLGATGESWQQVYWIMGRSPNSQNRTFKTEGPTLRTQAHDPSKLEDPSLIIYEAMLELPGKFLVSNGDQTRTLYEGLAKGMDMQQSLSSREREPDAPNYTPRITGLLDLSKPHALVTLSILKANQANPERSNRYYYEQEPDEPGLAFGLTTYMGDDEPLPSFAGDPLTLPLEASAQATLERYWAALDPVNRISIAVKEVSQDGARSRILLRNKHS